MIWAWGVRCGDIRERTGSANVGTELEETAVGAGHAVIGSATPVGDSGVADKGGAYHEDNGAFKGARAP